MGEGDTTINDQGDSSTPVSDGEVISTVEFTPEADAGDQNADKKGDGDGADDKSKTGDDKNDKTGDDNNNQDGKNKQNADDDKLTRFDKHPRFQQMLKENRAMKTRLEALEAAGKGKDDKAGEKDDPFSELAKEDPTELVDRFNENPAEFLKDFAGKITKSVMDGVKETQTALNAEQQVDATYRDYADKHEDFKAMWDNGEIQDYMDANPGHTPISAHAVLKLAKQEEQHQATLDGAVEAAKKEAEAAAIKSIQTKQGARVLSSSPTGGHTTSDSIPAELKDTKKYGGSTAVLAARLAARRAGNAQ